MNEAEGLWRSQVSTSFFNEVPHAKGHLNVSTCFVFFYTNQFPVIPTEANHSAVVNLRDQSVRSIPGTVGLVRGGPRAVATSPRTAAVTAQRRPGLF